MSYTQPRQYSVLPGQGVPDGVLVGQAQAGDQRAFELLVNRYHRSLASSFRSFSKMASRPLMCSSKCTSSSIFPCQPC